MQLQDSDSRYVNSTELENVIRDIEHAKRKTVTAMNVVYALRENPVRLWRLNLVQN